MLVAVARNTQKYMHTTKILSSDGNVPKISAQEGTANVQELSKLKELFPTEDEVDFDTVLKCSFNLEHAIDTLVNRSSCKVVKSGDLRDIFSKMQSRPSMLDIVFLSCFEYMQTEALYNPMYF
ncbi:uncharacterized protein LOC144652115 [Oculina patagonica]